MIAPVEGADLLVPFTFGQVFGRIWVTHVRAADPAADSLATWVVGAMVFTVVHNKAATKAQVAAAAEAALYAVSTVAHLSILPLITNRFATRAFQ
jgi:hypothetical protein